MKPFTARLIGPPGTLGTVDMIRREDEGEGRRGGGGRELESVGVQSEKGKRRVQGEMYDSRSG